MKAGDKITIGGITLKAEHQGSEHICKGCCFYSLGECSVFDMEKSNRSNCLDEEGNGLIFKEEIEDGKSST